MTHDPLQPLTPEEGGLHGDIPDTPEARAWFQELGEKAQTATHDPMCFLSHPCDVVCCDDDGRHRYSQDNSVKCACCEVVCECDFIAKVRADERSLCIAEVEALGPLQQFRTRKGEDGYPIEGYEIVDAAEALRSQP